MGSDATRLEPATFFLDDKGPQVNGKRWFSHALRQALLEPCVPPISAFLALAVNQLPDWT